MLPWQENLRGRLQESCKDSALAQAERSYLRVTCNHCILKPTTGLEQQALPSPIRASHTACTVIPGWLPLSLELVDTCNPWPCVSQCSLGHVLLRRLCRSTTAHLPEARCEKSPKARAKPRQMRSSAGCHRVGQRAAMPLQRMLRPCCMLRLCATDRKESALGASLHSIRLRLDAPWPCTAHTWSVRMLCIRVASTRLRERQ